MARLKILTGAHAGQTFALQGELHIGRSRGSSGRLEDKAIGFKHAAIRPAAAGAWEVVDARSLHGTFVNDERLERDVPRTLRPGDKVRFGDVEAVFELEPATTTEVVTTGTTTMVGAPAAAPADQGEVLRLQGEVLALQLRNRDLQDELMLLHGSDETLRELRRLREELAQAIDERDLLARRSALLEAEVERLMGPSR